MSEETTSLVDRLYDGAVCSPAQNYCPNQSRMIQAAETIARQTAEIEGLTSERKVVLQNPRVNSAIQAAFEQVELTLCSEGWLTKEPSK